MVGAELLRALGPLVPLAPQPGADMREDERRRRCLNRLDQEDQHLGGNGDGLDTATLDGLSLATPGHRQQPPLQIQV